MRFRKPLLLFYVSWITKNNKNLTAKLADGELYGGIEFSGKRKIGSPGLLGIINAATRLHVQTR